MKIPKRVKIGGHIYKIVLKDWDEEKDDDYVDGLVSDQKGTIELNRNLKQTAVECTFIHEMLHCMNTTLNHELLDSLAEQIYQALHDNKLLK